MDYASGGNYRILLVDGVARCAIWKREDVDSSAGARFAEEKIGHFQRLASGVARGMIFDLREAPPVTGPKTQAALGRMLAAWEKGRRPIAVVVGDNSLQLLQVTRLVREHAPTQGRLFTHPHEAAASFGVAPVSSASPAASTGASDRPSPPPSIGRQSWTNLEGFVPRSSGDRK